MSEDEKRKWLDCLKRKLSEVLSQAQIGPKGLVIDSVFDGFKKCGVIISENTNNGIQVSQAINKIFLEHRSSFPVIDKSDELKTYLDYYGDARINEFSDKLVAFFSRFPFTYTVALEIPQLSDLECMNLSLTDSVSAIQCLAIKPNDIEPSPYSLIMKNLKKGLPRKNKGKELGKSGLYLTNRVSGYIDGNYQDKVVRLAINRIKEAVFFLILEDVLVLSEDYEMHEYDGKFSKILFVESIGENPELLEIKAPYEFTHFLSRLKLSTKRKKEIDDATKSYEKSEVDRKAKGHQRSFLNFEPNPYLHLSPKFKKVVDYNRENQNVLPYKNAALWGLDALVNKDDPVNSYIKIAIALESVIGFDSERFSKTQLLADRCAYVAGHSITSRSEFRKKFIEFYRLRSELVHGSTNESDENLEKMLNWGQWVLFGILKREITRNRLEPEDLV